jgi:pimeloyl-ACP methyl ester carboxylesterase
MVGAEVTNTGSARQMLIEAAGVQEVSVAAAGTTSSALVTGSGVPLLLLHGFNAAGSLVWWPVFSGLAANHRVVAPDLPGLGESEAFNRPPSPSLVSEWLDDVVEECFDDPITLVATSLSGGFGLRFAAAHPKTLADADSGRRTRIEPVAATTRILDLDDYQPPAIEPDHRKTTGPLSDPRPADRSTTPWTLLGPVPQLHGHPGQPCRGQSGDGWIRHQSNRSTRSRTTVGGSESAGGFVVGSA